MSRLAEWHEAVSRGESTLVAHWLQESPSLIDEVDFAGRTALHHAVRRDDDAMVSQLLAAKPSDLDVCDFLEWTPLHYAALLGHHKAIEQLLAAGATANAIDDHHMTALHLAAKNGHEMAVAALLADLRVDVTAKGEHENTVLHYAACFAHDKVVARLLADPRIDVNAKDTIDCTPLHLAATQGNDKVVELLLADGRALINAKDSQGRTVLWYACKSELHDTKTLALILTQNPIEVDLQRILYNASDEFVMQLLAKRPLSEMLNCDRAIGVAIRHDRDQLLSHMLTLQPSLIDAIFLGHNMLQIAVMKGAAKSFEVLRALRPEWISKVNSQGNTLLHLACQSGKKEVVQKLKLWPLLSSDVRAVNKRGQIPFIYALQEHTNDAIELMQWKLCLDEILDAVAVVCCARRRRIDPITIERFRPVIEAECACLMTSWLNRDVCGTVFEYLGFERHDISNNTASKKNRSQKKSK